MLHRLEEDHAAQVNAAVARCEDQRRLLKHSDKKTKDLQDELAAQKEANNTMRKVVEDQKNLLARREKHVKVGVFCLCFCPSVSVS